MASSYCGFNDGIIIGLETFGMKGQFNFDDFSHAYLKRLHFLN